MKNATVKTNAIRILEQKKASFLVLGFETDGALSGVEAAAALQVDPAMVYKTLVTVGKSGANYVFVIPVAAELDLKKAAEAAQEKNIVMLKAKDLLGLTGYVHGGCSPVGMKKQFATFIDKSAETCASIIISGGKIGTHVEIALSELQKAVPFQLMELV